MIARSRRRFLAVLTGAFMLGLAAACGSPSPTPAPTGAPSPKTNTPPVTAAADVVFSGCGTAQYIEPTPQVVITTPGATPPGNAIPVTETDALSLVHATLNNTQLAHQTVQCTAKQFPSAVVAPFISGHPPLPEQLWAVVVAVSAAQNRTPVPGGGPPGAGLSAYEIFFVAPVHPGRIYGVTEYPPGVPLPTAFAGMAAA
jgi:hypothetical protein